MIQFACDSCGKIKKPTGIWILGRAAEAVGITRAYVTVCEYRGGAYLCALGQSRSSWLETPEAGPQAAERLPKFAAA